LPKPSYTPTYIGISATMSNDNSANLRTMAFSAFLALMVLLSMGTVGLVGAQAAGTTTLEDGDLVWQGETLVYEDDGTDTTAGGTVELRKNDDDNTFVAELDVSQDNNVTIDTDNYETGQFTLNLDGSASVNYEVAEQTLDVSSSEETVLNDDSGDTQTDLELESNRASYTVHVTSDQYDADELKELFGGSTGSVIDNPDEDESGDVLEVDEANTPLTADFVDEDAGDYDFNFEVADTGVEDDVTVTVQDPGDATAQWDQAGYQVAQGDPVEMTLSPENADSVDLRFGDSEDVGYEYNFTVNMNDADEVTLEFDSAIAGTGDVPFSIADDDSDATLANTSADTNLEDPLAAETYELAANISGDTVALSSVTVQERLTSGAVSHTAPAQADISELEEISENAVEDSSIALEDKFIVQVNTNGVYSALEVLEQDPGPNSQPNELDLSNANLYTDRDNEQFFVVFDTEDYSLEDGDEYEATFRLDGGTDEEGATDGYRFVERGEEEEVSTTFTFEERMVEFDTVEQEDGDEIVEALQSSETTLTGTTNVAEGTELTSRVLAVGLVDNDNVEVSGETFEVTHDLSTLEEGEEFEVRVTGETDTYNGVITGAQYDTTFELVDVATDEALNGTVTIDGTEYETEEGTVSAQLEEGEYTATANVEGFDTMEQTFTVEEDSTVTFEFDSSDPEVSFTVVDTNGEPLDATVSFDGDREDIAVNGGSATAEIPDGQYFLTASADGYQDATQPLTVDGEDTSLEFTLEAEEPAGDGSGDSDGDSSGDGSGDSSGDGSGDSSGDSDGEGSSDGNTDDSGSSDGNTDDSTPGFGALVALVALIAAALLATRRRNN
jgi:PGF-CTERM protein